MEEIYMDVDYVKPDNPVPSTNCTDTRSSKRNFHSGVIVSLGLLSIFLFIGLITLGLYYRDTAANLSEVSNKLAATTEERDLLHANLTENTRELERLQNLTKLKKTCPGGWRMFSCSCYLLSGSSGSWDAARKDCRDREADLVVIDSPEEQDFLTTFTQTETWIGLNDTQEEGKWKWVDGTPLTLTYWKTDQPDNGGGDPKWGEEDCAHFRNYENTLWNDISCANSLPWVCEKVP